MSVHLLMEGQHPAQQRLAFEELLAHHLSMQKLRLSVQQERALAITPADKKATSIEHRFREQLPFQLTRAQERVLNDIKQDIAKPYPAMRLVQGDVGSGKTVVAAIAALLSVESGYQSALMAPTELLAEQHFANMQSWCEPLGIKVGWLSSKVKGKARQAVLAALSLSLIHI